MCAEVDFKINDQNEISIVECDPKKRCYNLFAIDKSKPDQIFCAIPNVAFLLGWDSK
jgi:hypothetical protein